MGKLTKGYHFQCGVHPTFGGVWFSAVVFVACRFIYDCTCARLSVSGIHQLCLFDRRSLGGWQSSSFKSVSVFTTQIGRLCRGVVGSLACLTSVADLSIDTVAAFERLCNFGFLRLCEHYDVMHG